MNSEIIPFKEPRSLAGLAAKPPTVFLPNERTAELFFGFVASFRRRSDARLWATE
jgi:hypothetical protein